MELVADDAATTLEAIRLKTGGSLKLIAEYRRLILGSGGESQKDDLSQVVEVLSKIYEQMVLLNQTLQQQDKSRIMMSQSLDNDNQMIVKQANTPKSKVALSSGNDNQMQPMIPVVVPKVALSSDNDSRAKARELLLQGVNVAEVARQTDISESTVRRMRDKIKKQT